MTDPLAPLRALPRLRLAPVGGARDSGLGDEDEAGVGADRPYEQRPQDARQRDGEFHVEVG